MFIKKQAQTTGLLPAISAYPQEATIFSLSLFMNILSLLYLQEGSVTSSPASVKRGFVIIRRSRSIGYRMSSAQWTG